MKREAEKKNMMNIARLCFFRWKTEEDFRSKKQIFDFENFRVRSLKSTNALNFHITLAMAFLAHMTRKAVVNELLKSVLDVARAVKSKVQFYYYCISDEIYEPLRSAKIGIRDWFKPEKPNQSQLRFRLTA